MISPDFAKDFSVFSYALEHTIAAVLLQKNDENLEQPIAFFSKMLRDGELKYDIMEKQAYALIKALKDFRIYVLHSHVIAHVPTAVVKAILTQPDPEGRRARWIATLLEYDIEIKPTKLVKGQGLAKMMTNSNCESLQIWPLTYLTHLVLADFGGQIQYQNTMEKLQNQPSLLYLYPTDQVDEIRNLSAKIHNLSLSSSLPILVP